MTFRNISNRVAEVLTGAPVNSENAHTAYAHLRSTLKLDADTVLVINFTDGTNIKLDVDGVVTDERIETKYPTLAVMAKNLLSAAGRAAKNAATLKKVTVPDSVKTARMEECRSCDKWNADDKRCTICGCSTSVKLALATETCPHPAGPRWGKWEPEETQNADS